MKRVLVTGGAGFIGSHVAEALLSARPSRSRSLDDLSGGFADNVPGGARFIHGSVTDHAAVDRIFAEGRFDYVYHLAAYAAEGLSHFIKRFNYTNNVIGSVNLINAVDQHRREGLRLHLVDRGLRPEPGRADDRRDDSRARGSVRHRQVRRRARAGREPRRMFGLDYMIFRPHNVYGPRQNIGDRYRNVVGIFMNQILQDQPMTIFGDGTQTRAFSYIDDVAPVMAAAIDEPGAWNQVFNVGADEPWPLNELAERVAARDGRALRASPTFRRGTKSTPRTRATTKSRACSAVANRHRSTTASRRWRRG